MPVHIDMDEMAFGRWRIFVFQKNRKRVTHGTVADVVDPHRASEFLWKFKRRIISALRLHNEANDISIMEFQNALLDEKFIHDRVEIRVVDDIVDMAIDIIVGPPGL